MLLSVENLSVHYGSIPALEGVTFSLPEGATGLLGPNGAGKSTLLRILLGLRSPTQGRAQLLGTDPRHAPLRVRQLVGYLPEHECFVPGMTAVEYVTLSGRLIGMSAKDAIQRAHLVLNYVSLLEERYRPIDGYSTGMKQKAKLAQAIVHHPQLLFLDEPTAGLDPRGREEMLSLISDLVRHGVHVLLSTHILPDVESTCKHIAVLNRGRLLHSGPLPDLLGADPGVWIAEIRGDESQFALAVQEEGGKAEKLAEGKWKLVSPAQEPSYLFRAAVRSHAQIRHLGPARRTLEELFTQWMQQES